MKIKNGTVQISINRNNIFEDSFIEVMSKSSNKFKKILRIDYKGEKGVDAGGLLR